MNCEGHMADGKSMRRERNAAWRFGRLGGNLALPGLILALVLADFGQASAQTQGDSRILKCRAWVNPKGEIENGGLVVINNGRISQVGGSVPSGVTVEEFPDGVLSPGFVDSYSAITAADQLIESASAMQPDASAATSLNEYDHTLREAVRAGVTAFVLSPNDGNLVGGQAAFVVAGAGENDARCLSIPGPIAISLSPSVFRPERDPTSRSGALGMLRAALTGARGKPAENPLSGMLSGKRGALVVAPGAADVLSTIELSTTFGFKPVVINTDGARDTASEVASAGLPVVVGPLDYNSSRRALAAPGLYEAAGVRVAIAGGLPYRGAESLRIGAALAARNGLSAKTARLAITGTPAAIYGIDKELGAIATGTRANLVVLSGDPLDLRSRPIAVFCDGRRVAR